MSEVLTEILVRLVGRQLVTGRNLPLFFPLRIREQGIRLLDFHPPCSRF